MLFRANGVSALLFCILVFAFVNSMISGICAGEDENIFAFRVIYSQELTGRFSTQGGQEIVVDWGDGTSDVFSGYRDEYAKDYGKPVNAEVRIYAENQNAITEFRMDMREANIRFDLKDLPAGLVNVEIWGGNTVTGDIADLPPDMNRLVCAGNNTIRGDIALIPEDMTHFEIYGSNSITGDIGRLPAGMTRFECRGNSSLTGRLAEIPRGMDKFDARGDNTVSGDIADLPSGLMYFFCSGDNTVSGDITDLPSGLTYFYCSGDNTVSGDITDLPSGLTYFYCAGDNTVSGDIADLPAGLKMFFCYGGNTLRGNIASLPVGINSVDITGRNTVSDYKPGRKWAAGMRRMRVEQAPDHGLSTAELDGLLMDLSETTWTGERILHLAGDNGPRSSASDQAVEKLEEMGVRLTVRGPLPPLPGGVGADVISILEQEGL